MAAAVKITVELLDFNGEAGNFSFHIADIDFDATDPLLGVDAAIIDAIAAATDCQVTGLSASVRVGYEDDAAINTPYSQIEDKLKLSFLDDDGRVGAQMSLAGPASGLFLAGTNDLGDPADTALDDLVNALIAQAVTAAGVALTSLWKAYRTRSRTRQS